MPARKSATATARFRSKSAKIGTLCSSSLEWQQGWSGVGTRGNGLPTPFSCFALKWVESYIKNFARFLGAFPTSQAFFVNTTSVISSIWIPIVWGHIHNHNVTFMNGWFHFITSASKLVSGSVLGVSEAWYIDWLIVLSNMTQHTRTRKGCLEKKFT